MEKESSHEELQQALEEQSRELGSLNSEMISLHKDIERLQKKLERRDTTVRSLKKDLKERSRDGASLEASVSDEKAVTAKVQKSLDEANHSIADLESSLRARKAAEEVLRDDVAQSALKLDEMRSKASEFEIQSAELQAMLLESESEQRSVEQELEAQRELVQVLEREIGNKQENLDILDRSVDRLSAIGSEIRELDFQIDDLWLQQPAKTEDRSEEIFEHPDEVLLDPEALFDAADEHCEHCIVTEEQGTDDPVRFPLHGSEITIGRSRRSNIRLESKYISRIHARIKVDGACAIIEDAGSTNGFLVNSVHKTHHELAHGDKLEIGDRKLQYLHTSSAI